MPQVVNGCGTWYHGKKNVQQYQGTCQSCRSLTTLTSYDTRLWVVIIFAPIIPLGRKRIIEECAACQRHGVMPLADWERARTTIDTAIKAYRGAPTDKQLAEDALRACLASRDLPAFLTVAPEIEQHLAHEADPLLMVAACYQVFGRAAEHERLLRAALAVKDSDDTREALADCLLRQGKPVEAAPYMQHVIDQVIPDRVDLVYGLAQGYQIKGMHTEALAAFDHCEAIHPAIIQNETFGRLRAASQQHVGTNKVVKPAEIVQRAKTAAGWRKFGRFMTAAVVLAIVGYFVLAWIIGRNRQVHLINGLERPCVIRFNTTEFTLQPHEVVATRVTEGTQRVELMDPPGLPAENVRVNTGFLTRPFRKYAFAINPDQTAIVRWSRVYYSKGGGRAPMTQVAAGQTLHAYTGVDCAFTDFPREVQIGSGSSETHRDGVALVMPQAELPSATLLEWSQGELSADIISHVAQRHLTLEPQRTEFLEALALGKPEATAAFLRTGLARRPVEVEWHRAYQTAMTRLGKDDVSAQEYDAMLAAEPADPDLLYLAARTTDDIDRAVALCTQAAGAAKPGGYANYWLSGYTRDLGDFPQAVAYGRKAAALLPDNPEVQKVLAGTLFAAGEYDAALELLHTLQKQPISDCMDLYTLEIEIAAARNLPTAADDVLSRLMSRLRRLSPALASSQNSRFNIFRAYTFGDTAAYTAAETSDEQDAVKFSMLLTKGDLEGAEKIAQSLPPGAFGPVLLYIAAMQHGQRDLADRQRQAAVAALQKGRAADRAYAAALDGKGTLPLATLLRMRPSLDRKHVLLTALGLHDPAARADALALARKLNFERKFPYLLLQQVFEAAPGP